MHFNDRKVIYTPNKIVFIGRNYVSIHLDLIQQLSAARQLFSSDMNCARLITRRRSHFAVSSAAAWAARFSAALRFHGASASQSPAMMQP